ncbi:MAG: hypothetical protein IJW40_06500 [Clostridia bacterium]|nr:hypothetical protein [Clostridia bacterium]
MPKIKDKIESEYFVFCSDSEELTVQAGKLGEISASAACGDVLFSLWFMR